MRSVVAALSLGASAGGSGSSCCFPPVFSARALGASLPPCPFSFDSLDILLVRVEPYVISSGVYACLAGGQTSKLVVAF